MDREKDEDLRGPYSTVLDGLCQFLIVDVLAAVFHLGQQRSLGVDCSGFGLALGQSPSRDVQFLTFLPVGQMVSAISATLAFRPIIIGFFAMPRRFISCAAIHMISVLPVPTWWSHIPPPFCLIIHTQSFCEG